MKDFTNWPTSSPCLIIMWPFLPGPITTERLPIIYRCPRLLLWAVYNIWFVSQLAPCIILFSRSNYSKLYFCFSTIYRCFYLSSSINWIYLLIFSAKCWESLWITYRYSSFYKMWWALAVWSSLSAIWLELMSSLKT